MTSQDVLPLFGKENRGICSFGAFLVLEADKDAMLLKGQGWLSYDACMEQFVGTTPYLLQRLERNHGFFDRYTDSLATVRVCVLISEDGIKIPFAILKLPSRENVADSFWRPGNLACNLDLQERPNSERPLQGRFRNDGPHGPSGYRRASPWRNRTHVGSRSGPGAHDARPFFSPCGTSRWISASRRPDPF